MLQKWIKAEEAVDMPAGAGVVIIRPVTRHNGKKATIRQLRPATETSPASVASHLDRRLAAECSHADQLCLSGSDTKTGIIC